MPQNIALRDQILRITFKRFDGLFSDGTYANNKLEADYDALSAHPDVFNQVVDGLCEIIKQSNPEFVIGVPNGAVGIAAVVADRLGIAEIRLSKDKATKKLDYESEGDREKLSTLSRGAIIEDVYRTGSNIQRCLNFDSLDDKVDVVAAVFDRSIKSDSGETIVKKPIFSVVSMPIETTLPDNSELWQYVL